MRLARVLGAIGRTCIAAGILILLFVAYQLWGTGIREAQAQRKLENEFEQRLGDAGVAAPDESAQGPGPTPTPTTTGPPPPPAAEGDAVAHLSIPDIGVDKIVIEGVALADLKRGPGHYPETPLPGQPGNAAIAGHRTTYGAPFNRINELERGDEILVTTVQGAFRYEVSDQLIVSPSEVGVLDDFGDNRLTLTACHPKYSARQRIIVVAALVGEAAPAPGAPAGPATGAIPGDGETSGGNDSGGAKQKRRRAERRHDRRRAVGRAGRHLAGHRPRRRLRAHLDSRLAAGQALEQVAGVPAVPATVPAHALLLLRELLAGASGQLLIGPAVPYDRGAGGTLPAAAGTPQTRTAAR